MRKGILIGFLVGFLFLMFNEANAEMVGPWTGSSSGPASYAMPEQESSGLTKEKVWGDLFDRVAVQVKSGEISVSVAGGKISFTQELIKLSLSWGYDSSRYASGPYFIKAEFEIVHLEPPSIKTKEIKMYRKDSLYLKAEALYQLALEAPEATLSEIDQSFR